MFYVFEKEFVSMLTIQNNALIKNRKNAKRTTDLMDAIKDKPSIVKQRYK